MSNLNEKQRAIVGNWELESSENFDEFMRELGLNYALRSIAAKLRPKTQISVEGDIWTIKVETMVRNETFNFKMGEKFIHDTPIGVKLECFLEIDENGKIDEVQEMLSGGNKGQKTYVTRYIENDRMITLLETKNIKAKRIYARSR